MEPYCYLNGQIIPVKDASVNVYDIGLLRGFGVYDGIPVYNGKSFRLADHLDRFRNSAAGLGLRVPESDNAIEKLISDVLARNNFTDQAVLRLVLTGGQTVGGIEFDPTTPTFMILAEPWLQLGADVYAHGASLITHEHARFLPEYKTINYITAVMQQGNRKKAGAIEILFVSGGRVLEAATSNFLAFVGDTLVAPKRGVLGGITRKVVLEHAAPLFVVEQRDLTIEELRQSSETFITSSFKEIVPIVKIDDGMVGNGKPGERTLKLLELYRQAAKST